MKKGSLFVFLFLIAAYFVQAQDTLFIYYNSSWEKTDKTNSTFIRKAYLNSGFWMVQDFYSKTGNLEKVGTYKSIHDNIKEGFFTFYYENGGKKSEGRFYDGFKIGIWQSWYENGAIRSKEQYIDDIETVKKIKSEGIISLGYKLNVGKYFLDSLSIFQGISQWFYSNGQMSAEEEWGNTLISVKHWNETGKKQKVDFDKENPVLGGVVKGPRPKNDYRSAFNADGYNAGKGGKVLMKFTVNEKGSLEEISISQSSGDPNLDDKALSMVKVAASREWEVGRRHNLPSIFVCLLPISFNKKGNWEMSQ